MWPYCFCHILSQRRRQQPPNPFQQKGDITEKWHRRLNLIEEEEEAEEEAGKAPEDSDQQREAPPKDSDGKGV